MHIHWRRAARHRFKKDDIPDLDSDGRGSCPACNGFTCEPCGGSGAVPENYLLIERERVLLTAFQDRIYPRITVESFIPYNRRMPVERVRIDDECLLSDAAGTDCSQRGEVSIIHSMFGTSISLTRRGYAEVARYFDDGTARFLTRNLPEAEPWL